MTDNKKIFIINYDYIAFFIIYKGNIYNIQVIDKEFLPFTREDIEHFIYCDFIDDSIFNSLGVDTIYYLDCGELYKYGR